jgi:hypothetical protein
MAESNSDRKLCLLKAGGISARQERTLWEMIIDYYAQRAFRDLRSGPTLSHLFALVLGGRGWTDEEGARQPRGERRWIVLGGTGGTSLPAHHSGPTEAEIAAAEQALAAQGLRGRLAVAEGDYWAKRGRGG